MCNIILILNNLSQKKHWFITAPDLQRKIDYKSNDYNQINIDRNEFTN